MVICTGYGQGIALVLPGAGRAPAPAVAVEDPSPTTTRADRPRGRARAWSGSRSARTASRSTSWPAAARTRWSLTPSHQWPTGAVLPAEPRAAVLRWARERGALVIEDDYDAEYRYDRAPVGAMQGLAPDLVVYAGSASKTLAPGLRIGWLVLPRHLADGVAAAKVAADRGSSALDQLAFADFLARGEFDRHLRRMRPVYRRRRDALLAALAERLPELPRPASRPACTWSPGCRRTWTRPRWSPRPRAGACGCTASRRAGSPRPAPAG